MYLIKDKSKCYYFNYMMVVGNFDNFLLDEKSFEHSYKNILIYDISYKTFMGAKPLSIRFDKIDGFIKSHDET